MQLQKLPITALCIDHEILVTFQIKKKLSKYILNIILRLFSFKCTNKHVCLQTLSEILLLFTISLVNRLNIK